METQITPLAERGLRSWEASVDPRKGVPDFETQTGPGARGQPGANALADHQQGQPPSAVPRALLCRDGASTVGRFYSYKRWWALLRQCPVRRSRVTARPVGTDSPWHKDGAGPEGPVRGKGHREERLRTMQGSEEEGQCCPR